MKKTIFSLICFLFLSSGVFGKVKLYSVEVRNAPLKDIVRMLAKMDGKNVVIPATIEGVANASFGSTDLEEALRAILEANGFGLVIKENVIQVVTQEILEKMGEDLVTTTFPLKYAKASLLGSQVKSLLSARGSMMVDDRLNAITVRETPVFLEDIRTLVANIDKQDRQVLIEGRILEAKVDFIRSLGIQWGVTKTSNALRWGGLKSVGTADNARTLGLNTPAESLSGGNPLSGLAIALGPFHGAFTDIQLSAAEQKGDVAILSRPSIVTMNNQSANIHSGLTFFVKTSGNVTIGSATTGTTASTGSNLQQINAGIDLKVTPQITIDDKITLVVDVKESQPDFSRVVDGIPTIIENNASTQVFLNDGETTVIGGLFQLQKTKTKKGVPGFQRIPLLGNLFHSNTKGKSKSELLIFIKPTIVKEGMATLPSYEYEEPSFLEPEEKKKK